jgi:cytokinin trans-hydroxylase
MVIQILLYLFVTIIFLTFVIIYFKFIRSEKRLYNAFYAQGVNCEPDVFLIGQIPQIRRHRKTGTRMDFHQELMRKHGNIYTFCSGLMTRLMISEPDLLANILHRNNAQKYTKPSVVNTVLSAVISEQNLLVAEDNEHERARRMINPAFHHINLRSMTLTITDRTAKTVQSTLITLSSNEQKSQPVDLQILFNNLTLSVIITSAFRSDFETNTNAKNVMTRALTNAHDAIIYRSLQMINLIFLLSKLPLWKKDVVNNGARVITEFADQTIVDRRQSHSTRMSNGADRLDLLLSAVDNKRPPFTDQQMKQQALTFLLAGSETTRNLMSWIFFVLMTHDDVLAACRGVDRVLPNGIEPTNEHLSELIVCEAIINKTSRLYSSESSFSPRCIREHVIGIERSLRIPMGTNIMVSNRVLHRQNDLWPRGEEFDYTHWMRDSKADLKPKLSHPCATGPRNFIGQNSALLETKIMLSMFVQQYNFESMSRQRIIPEVRIIVHPKFGLLARISKN